VRICDERAGTREPRRRDLEGPSCFDLEAKTMEVVRAEQITALVGEVDPLVIERIISTGATVDEVAEAVAEIEAELVEGEAIRIDAPPPSPRVSTVRALLEPEFEEDDENLLGG